MGKGKTQDRPRVLILGSSGAKNIRDAGGEAVPFGYSDKRAVEAAQHRNIHAILLTGGSDISPHLYGQEPHPQTQTPFVGRDEVEVRTLHAAYKRGIPIMGICRGNQMINAAFGGTLHQHIGDLEWAHRYHLGYDHRVDFIRGTRLAKATREEEAWVTSIHHQAVDKVAPGFRVAAKSRDGLIEAIESEVGWILGVQFHPEIDTHLVHQRMFNAFLRAAARVAGMPKPEPRPWREVKPKPVLVKPAPTKDDDRERFQSDRVRDSLTASDRKTFPATKAVTVNDFVRGRLTTWKCYRCGIEFEERIDHVDHMWFMHEVDLTKYMTDREIMALVDEAPDRTQFVTDPAGWSE